MTPLLEQFLSEGRDFLQGIGDKLMRLEREPGSGELMTELFRLVHTLKGNSGLFEFPEMTRVLHAGEDLMDAVRDGRVPYSQILADRLLEAMDFVSLLLDEIEAERPMAKDHASASARLAQSLRALIDTAAIPARGAVAQESDATAPVSGGAESQPGFPAPLADVPESVRMDLYRGATVGAAISWVDYAPEEECFFKGEDPFHLVRQIPDVAWRTVLARQGWPALEELDPYRCQLRFQILTTAEPAILQDLFRYAPDQVDILGIPPESLVLPQGDVDSDSLDEQFVADASGRIEARDVAGLDKIARAMLERLPANLSISSALRWLLVILELEPSNYRVQRALIDSLRTLELAPLPDPSASSIRPPDVAASVENARSFEIIVAVQREILDLPDDDALFAGRIKAAAASLAACYAATGNTEVLPSLDVALATALASGKAAPLIQWIDEPRGLGSNIETLTPKEVSPRMEAPAEPLAPLPSGPDSAEGEIKFGRRAEDAYAGPKAIKVEQAKIDRLMSLIGEMVVAKNSLPYLAARAETHYGVRELAREIKNQYAVINRIAEELQDSIMQVRMMPVSFIFQRFPRLVRDTSRKLDKQVNLVLEGEQTEADKTIVEALSDPLIHIVRNSLDHGIELPEVRRAAGKPELGQLTIRARQESDRVLIEVADDGKGIDAQIVRRKAYEKGLIDEAALERLSDQEAIDLVFAPGFSTVEIVSDLSGRGVGMDVVRSAMEKVNGTVTIASERGKGTCVRLSLPLSMAVTNVIVIESDGQIFGVPMDIVVETVRVPRSSVRTIKQRQAAVLRGRIVPLLSLNELLAVGAEQRPNEDDELATLVVRIHGENVGVVVDEFRETVDVILKPMDGILGGLSGYSGSALLGDGSVLMVLNPKELM